MLLHPSVDEGFGLPPLEAMAMGVPTVVSSAGSLPEVVGDSAVLVDPHDADGWASAITAVAADSEQRTRLIATGRARAANFTWQQAADKTIAVHQDCLRP
jgi:glycosyltransferase involved in cell wall biosynthesis